MDAGPSGSTGGSIAGTVIELTLGTRMIALAAANSHPRDLGAPQR